MVNSALQPTRATDSVANLGLAAAGRKSGGTDAVDLCQSPDREHIAFGKAGSGRRHLSEMIRQALAQPEREYGAARSSGDRIRVLERIKGGSWNQELMGCFVEKWSILISHPSQGDEDPVAAIGVRDEPARAEVEARGTGAESLPGVRTTDERLQPVDPGGKGIGERR